MFEGAELKNLLLIAALVLVVCLGIDAQTITLKVSDSKTKEAIIGASVVVKGTSKGGITDTSGNVTIANMPKAGCTLVISCIGYTKSELQITGSDIKDRKPLVALLNAETANLGEVTITAMRNNSRIEDSPTNIEVLGQEEMTEEGSIKPGNIVSLLGDIAGIQMQQTSETSGNMNARIQGMHGRYTQILRDGVPLFGGYSGSFSLLQIPPLDLRQIEIIKGTSSTLFGGGAISGIINLVSRKPGEKTEGSLVVNQTTLQETDINGFVSGKTQDIGYTVFAGFVGQRATDVNKDNFSDVPKVRNYMIHPKLFYYFENNTSLTLGLSSAFEQRKGGDMYVIDNSVNANHTYFVNHLSARNNADLSFEKIYADGSVFACKAAAGFLNRSIETQEYFFQGHQLDYYGEVSYFHKGSSTDFVFGLSAGGQNFTSSRNKGIAINKYDLNTGGFFIQNNTKISEQFSVESGLRVDYNSDNHAYVLPRLSMMYKLTPVCYIRLNGGLGYKTPDVFSYIDEETELKKYRESNVSAEIAKNVNLDFNYTIPYDKVTSITFDQSFFYTRLSKPVEKQAVGAYETLVNMDKPVESYGAQTYARLAIDEYEIYLSYVYTHAVKKYDSINPSFLATPEHNAAVMVMLDLEAGWRLGLESSFYGRQIIENNAKTPSYVFMAVMLAKEIGCFTFVLNCENLFDYRQKDYMTLVGTTPVFKTLWAPIDGRVVNLSVNVKI
jgi:outer membrane receptor for ferrienterochelin and colicins